MTTDIDELARHIAPNEMGQARISLDAFSRLITKAAQSSSTYACPRKRASGR